MSSLLGGKGISRVPLGFRENHETNQPGDCEVFFGSSISFRKRRSVVCSKDLKKMVFGSLFDVVPLD